jgi:hypothetical protein
MSKIDNKLLILMEQLYDLTEEEKNNFIELLS